MESFEKKLAESISEHIKRIADEEIKKAIADASAQIENRVRSKVGAIAASIVSNMDFERFDRNLRITVRFPDDNGSHPQR